MGIANIVFLVLLIATAILFTHNVRKIAFNINLGRGDLDRTDNKGKRWQTMARVALGQSKMGSRPIAAFLHLIVYAGFIIINIEVLEIVIDGITGAHRTFSFLGVFYFFLINAFEVLALLVLLACVVFLIRRNIIRIKRFHFREMTKWPKSDANIILIVEILLMSAFLIMNAADTVLMNSTDASAAAYAGSLKQPSFLVSQHLTSLLPDSVGSLILIERFCWWFHIIGIFLFLNYLPYSKHFHIILAFPNTYYSNLKPKGQFNNLESVKKEVALMMDPNADPFAAPAPDENAVHQKFGAKDVTDLSWKSLMDAYTCTECGRCSDACPANQTGKLLSPRKIMMDTRDRLEEVGKNKRKHGKDHEDAKALLGDYITAEELWACTSCNACVQECPVNIDPLTIIVDLRRYLVMEQSQAPNELNMMFTNIENNGAPWQFSPSDRGNWRDEL